VKRAQLAQPAPEGPPAAARPVLVPVVAAALAPASPSGGGGGGGASEALLDRGRRLVNEVHTVEASLLHDAVTLVFTEPAGRPLGITFACRQDERNLVPETVCQNLDSNNWSIVTRAHAPRQVVRAIASDSPAAVASLGGDATAASLEPGMVLSSVQGVPVTGKPLQETVGMIKAAGRPLSLGRLRRGPSAIVPLQSPLYGEFL
jgi:hypothetical protein